MLLKPDTPAAGRHAAVGEEDDGANGERAEQRADSNGDEGGRRDAQIAAAVVGRKARAVDASSPRRQSRRRALPR